MKVLIVNGSPKLNGGTHISCEIAQTVLKNEGIDAEIINLGKDTVNDCIGCGACRNKAKCIFGDNDGVNEFIEKSKTADGFIFAAPVYYAHPAARILSFMDRIFYRGSEFLAHKPASSINISRRAGGVTSMDVMNKYFTINQMPVVSSTYWNEPHYDSVNDLDLDAEGVVTVKNMAKNMAWLLKCIEIGKNNGISIPTPERARTNFINK